MTPFFIICFMLTVASSNANPVKRSDLSPTTEEALVPGTKVPIKKMNTAPTALPVDEKNKKSRNILKSSKANDGNYLPRSDKKLE